MPDVPDVPGVTGVPGVHGVTEFTDGLIFDLPGTLKYIHYLVASFWVSQRRCKLGNGPNGSSSQPVGRKQKQRVTLEP